MKNEFNHEISDQNKKCHKVISTHSKERISSSRERKSRDRLILDCDATFSIANANNESIIPVEIEVSPMIEFAERTRVKTQTEGLLN